MAVEEGTGRSILTSKRLPTYSNVLVHFDPGQEIVLSCDVSAYGIGAVLAQRLADGSKKTNKFCLTNTLKCRKDASPS